MMVGSRVLAGVCGAWLVLGGASGAVAGPAEGEAAEATEAPPPAPPVSVGSVRRNMEKSMAALGELAADAKRDTDLVRAACVLDKQERAQGVMELATGELLVIRDANASAEARTFAAEKLEAASERLEGLVNEAKECVGDKTPEEKDDETRNEVEVEPSIPVLDPTVHWERWAGRPGGFPPPVDDGMPPSIGSPSY